MAVPDNSDTSIRARPDEAPISPGASPAQKGDPEGRRLARRRAALLSEAERVARALEILLRRANYPTDRIASLLDDLSVQQRIELQRAFGHIEPRKRFKSKSGHPLLERLPVTTLYVDESGTSRIPVAGTTEHFALGSIAISDSDADRYRVAADAIKMRFFGRTDFQFHEPFMRNRQQTRSIDYSFGGDEQQQQEFDVAITRLISDAEFVSFGVAIRKNGFRDDFVQTGIDPYLPTDVYCVALTLLLERYVDALSHTLSGSMGRVRLESQGPKEDAYHQLEYARLLVEGSQWVSERAFQSRLEAGILFSPKSSSNPSELSDFFARDLYEWARSDCLAQPRWWDLFCSKVYVRGDGTMGKFGIKVFPDSDIRDRIDAHRRRFGASLV